MAVREQRDVAVNLHGAVDYIVRAGGDLADGFSAHHAIAKDLPAWPGGANLVRGQPFVPAVVPLREIRVDLRLIAVARQLACAHGPIQRTGEDKGELMSREFVAYCASTFFSGGCQRNIGATGVCAGKTPFSFAVPDEPEHV